MTPGKLFELIEDIEYHTSGLSVDWNVLVDEVDKTIRLVFQETTSKEDWKTNFSFPAKIYKEQEYIFLVHGGYGKAWKSCNDEVMESFIGATYDHPDYKTEITGWSYGGAMAVIAAEDYKYRTGKKVDELITFGAPKPIFGIISWIHFRKSVAKIKQYCLSYDFVSWLPPFFLRLNTKLVDKRNCWKLWRVFNIEKYHCSYGNEEYYR